MDISGKTTIVGLFGYPVKHSLSPLMHNAAFDYLHLDYCYVPFPVRPDLLGAAVSGIRALALRGVNITVPHKEQVIAFLDSVDEEASFIRAVNTIVNRDGVLTGYNTDGRGFMESLAEAGITVEGKRILILGAGGACRAVGYYLSKKAASLLITDVDIHKAGKLVDDLRKISPAAGVLNSLHAMPDIDILINATPLGLKDADPDPVDSSLITEGITVCDLIYRDTPFLKKAARKGCRTLNGLGMLLHQGVLAFELWTGVKPPVEVMREALLKHI